jgi:hypothetical protein
VIFRLELDTVPVSVFDVDRAKAFYVDQAGFSAQQDHQVDESHRFVVVLPAGGGAGATLRELLRAAAAGLLAPARAFVQRGSLVDG